jgi:hypothetical protein
MRTRNSNTRMPLKLNVGVARKLGLPGFSSIGVHCHLELELPERLVEDRAALQRRVRAAYFACDQAIRNEFDRHRGAGNRTATGDDRPVPITTPRCGSHYRDRTPATGAQLRALHAIALRRGVDLAEWLTARSGIPTVTQLSVTDAGRLIAALQAKHRETAC